MRQAIDCFFENSDLLSIDYWSNMPNRTVIHITYDGEKWKVKKEGAQRAIGVFDTKDEAVNQSIEQAKKQPLSQVVIHKKDNTIQEERTYGKDPYPPIG